MGAQRRGSCPLLLSSCSTLGSTCLGVGLYFSKALAFILLYRGSLFTQSVESGQCHESQSGWLSQQSIALANVAFTLLSLISQSEPLSVWAPTMFLGTLRAVMPSCAWRVPLCL